MRFGFLGCGTALAMLAAVPVDAALLQYTITGTSDDGETEYASFYLDSNPIPLPQNAGPDNFRLKFVSGVFHYGSTVKAVQDIVFFADSFGGGLVAVDPTVAGNDPDFFLKTLLNYGGDTLYSGPGSAPTLLTGDFTLYDYNSRTAPAVALKVALVPEPASWAMLVVGFGAVGAAMRRRRTTLAFG